MKRSQRALVTVLLLLAWSLSGLTWADLSRGVESLQSLTTKADLVVHGSCVAKQVTVQKGLFLTTYEIKVHDVVKGKAVRNGDSLALTLIGGSFSRPPLSQAALGVPAIAQDEEVVLFLATPKSVARNSQALPQLASSPRLVGMWQGKFSVFTDPVDGRKKVTRINPERYGFIPRDDVLNTILRALKNGELETSNTTDLVAVGGGLNTTPDGAELLSRAVRITEQQRNADKAMLEKLQQKRDPLPAQLLDDFKAQIRKCAQ